MALVLFYAWGIPLTQVAGGLKTALFHVSVGPLVCDLHIVIRQACSLPREAKHLAA